AVIHGPPLPQHLRRRARVSLAAGVGERAGHGKGRRDDHQPGHDLGKTSVNPLPEADAATREYFIRWLETFSGYVREVDYASARPLFHPDVLAFGTHRDLIPGPPEWQATQWDNVWPRTSDFRFDTQGMHVLVSADHTMATVVAPWTSTGYH